MMKLNYNIARALCTCIIYTLYIAVSSALPIVINELMPSNHTGITDATGEHTDWIELYNPNAEHVNLQDYSISDNNTGAKAFIFPYIYIEGRSHLLLYASNKAITPENELHLNFKLDQDGETITLRDHTSNIISEVDFNYIPTDCSFARYDDGHNNFVINEQASPNRSNTPPLEITCSHASGFYTEAFNLALTINPAYSIYYTTNGEQPTSNSEKYHTPILLTDKNQSDYTISHIPTTAMDSKVTSFGKWRAPETVYQCNTIRFAAFLGDKQLTRTQTRTYFIEPHIGRRYSMPIFSLAMDPHDLFDYTDGLYVAGKVYDTSNYKNGVVPGNYHNQADADEKKMHISYFETDGTLLFSTDAGMKIRGFGSATLPQKSINVYFRKKYGKNAIDYPLFEEIEESTFKRLVLRSGGNDFTKSHFRDPLLQEIIKDLDLELQAYKPAILFINGEYWGIHNLREKLSKHYFESKFGIEEKDLNLLNAEGEVIVGSKDAYWELLDFVATHELKIEDNYNYVASLVDIDNFIDYNIAEIYFANYDWPCNNYKIWKTNASDSKWRFLIYDLDLSFGYAEESKLETKSIEHALTVEEQWPYCECSNRLLINLMRNEVFVDRFLNRFRYCLQTTFDPERVNTIIDNFETSYLPEIDEHILRWGYPSSKSKWQENISDLRNFANKRAFYVEDEIYELFYNENSSLGVETRKRIELYPNPNNGQMNIVNLGISTVEDGHIQVIDMQGRVVYNSSVRNLETNELLNLNIEKNLTTGIYSLLLYNQHSVIRHKLLIN